MTSKFTSYLFMFFFLFPQRFTLHQGDKSQHSRLNAKSKRPLSLKRLAVDVGKEKEREIETGQEDEGERAREQSPINIQTAK